VPRRPYAQFLELLFQDEIYVRHQHLINRRQKLADFCEPRSLDNFDFSFNANINRAQIYELATGHFVAQRRDVLLVGPPGVGKSHLVLLARFPSPHAAATLRRRFGLGQW
jgi:DNA replication protein DnaC